MANIVDIGPATLERERSDLVVIRFKPGSVAGAESFLTSINGRREHFADTPHAVLLLAPEDADFQPSLMDRNHYKGQDVNTFTVALAIVSGNERFASILELYYALHPSPFPTRVFREEGEARRWLEEQLASRP